MSSANHGLYKKNMSVRQNVTQKVNIGRHVYWGCAAKSYGDISKTTYRVKSEIRVTYTNKTKLLHERFIEKEDTTFRSEEACNDYIAQRLLHFTITLEKRKLAEEW